MRTRRYLALILVVLMAVSMLAACGQDTTAGGTPSASASAGAQTPETKPSEPGAAGIPTIDAIKLGEDYKDLKASIKFLTHRTDLVDGKFKEYIAEFKKLYPNIDVTYEAITDYREDVIIRLTTDDWGDVCMIPTTISKSEAPDYFVSFGSSSDLGKIYNSAFMVNWEYEGQIYGLPSTCNAQGIVYNKRVFKEAGVTTLPKTPDEFLNALKKIKDNTDAIPLYTNFAAGWTMGAWDAYLGGSVGDPEFMNVKLPHMKDPFANKGDGTGPFAVYNILYEAVKRGLVEDDPTTTDWEGCKGMMNRGEIGVLVLGSWAVSQMQDPAQGPNGADVGYMPFPISVNGKQYAAAGPDYCYGINVNASDDNKIAAMLYIKWLTEKSRFAYTEGGIPLTLGEEYPDLYSAFAGCEYVVDVPGKAGEETLQFDISALSEVGLNQENSHVQAIVEAALDGSMTMEEIAADWNKRWADAQAKKGASIDY
jgi:raffinose/stachyose/melibiose transport system substrate-binding protein